jgi:hypothetical protein
MSERTTHPNRTPERQQENRTMRAAAIAAAAQVHAGSKIPEERLVAYAEPILAWIQRGTLRKAQ